MEKTVYRNEKAIATVRCVLTVRERRKKCYAAGMMCTKWQGALQDSYESEQIWGTSFSIKSCGYGIE